MSKESNQKSVKAGVIISAVAVLIAMINLIVSSFISDSVFFWSAFTIFFSTLAILFANLSSYSKKKKQSD